MDFVGGFCFVVCGIIICLLAHMTVEATVGSAIGLAIAWYFMNRGSRRRKDEKDELRLRKYLYQDDDPGRPVVTFTYKGKKYDQLAFVFGEAQYYKSLKKEEVQARYKRYYNDKELARKYPQYRGAILVACDMVLSPEMAAVMAENDRTDQEFAAFKNHLLGLDQDADETPEADEIPNIDLSVQKRRTGTRSTVRQKEMTAPSGYLFGIVVLLAIIASIICYNVGVTHGKASANADHKAEVSASEVSTSRVPEVDQEADEQNNSSYWYDRGYDTGYEEAQSDLKGTTNTSVDNSYDEGYSAGYDAGYSDGQSAGDAGGYNTGYTEGYNAGQTAGFNSGYDAGESSGYGMGYTEGYTSGYTDAANAAAMMY